MKRLDCEYHLLPGEGRFLTEIGRWSGPVDLAATALNRLGQQPDEAYGNVLFELLFPEGPLREGYRTAQAHVRREDLRLRLRLDAALPVPVLEIAWEQLYDRERGEPLARSGRLAFSRSLPVSGIAVEPARRLRPLAAVADPSNLADHGLADIDRESVERALPGCFRSPWPWRARGILQGPVTLTTLQEKLQTGRFNTLHLVAHGLPPAWAKPGLVLQKENGIADLANDACLVEALGTSRHLRLLVLLACHGADLRRDGIFLDLAERLALGGIPAIVAIRREITLAAARVFTRTFYAALARSGEVDVAVNEARRQLFIAKHTEWRNVVLFMKGVPWQKGPSRIPWAAGLAGALGLGLGGGALIPGEPPPVRPPEIRIVEKPAPPPPPFLQVTRVAGREVKPGQVLTVPPSGDIEGTLQWRPAEHKVRAEVAGGGSVAQSPEQRLEASAAPWVLQGVRFRTPQNLRESQATVTVRAGTHPAVASATFSVRVDPPVVRLETICGQPAATVRAGCDPFLFEGTAENVLEGAEKIWVEVRKQGDGNILWQRCLYGDVRQGRWRAAGSLGDWGPAGTYRVRFGLVAEPPGGQACPEDLEAFDELIFPAGGPAQ